MGSFSNFFPTPTAGGVQITNPDELPKTYGPGTDFSISQPNNSQRFTSNQNDFWTYLGYNSDISTLALSSTNTYETIVNITNASRGGFMYWALGPAGLNAGYGYLRITVDGTEYEYSWYGWLSGEYSRGAIGGIYPAQAMINNTAQTEAYLINNGSTQGFHSSSTSHRITFNGFGTDDIDNARYTVPPAQVAGFLPKLKFETSLKVEAKVNWNAAAASSNREKCAVYAVTL
jgi:hypothetical protein